MNRNILKELHEDIRKIIIDKYVDKKKLSISKIEINHDFTIIEYHIKDKNENYLETERIEFSNDSWNTKE